MATLTVKNFICVDDAVLDIAPLTVVIGPQGSGKSILAKLAYFCVEALRLEGFEVDGKLPFDEHTKKIESDFVALFPPASWENRAFQIHFEVGAYDLTIRSRSAKVSVEFGKHFRKDYEDIQVQAKAALDAASTNVRDDFQRKFAVLRGVRELTRERQVLALGSEFTDSTIFVPAGRTLFNYIGRTSRATHGLAHALDPITERFGSLVEALRGFLARRSPKRGARGRHDDAMRTLFGGDLVFEKDGQTLHLADGRSIPVGLLSSGLQELLPLWIALEYVNFGSTLTFVEEPEAHLFPATQSKLIEYLATIVGNSSNNQKLFVTTHSPYTLAKMNNLIKAGDLSQRFPKERKKIRSIVPKDAWLSQGTVKAYAIIDRSLASILDDDGLIDADYLDSVSGDISQEFLKLLEIEFPND